jgi:ribose transport system substrate-binding protein
MKFATMCAGLAAVAATMVSVGAAPALAQDKKPYVIYLSNNFVGNDWRQQMQRVAQVSVDKGPLKGRVELHIEVAEGTVQAQINSLNNIIRQKPDAILVDAASDTALNPTIKKACDAGIVVISFDQVVTEPCALTLASNWERIPAVMAEWMAVQLGGKGNVLVDRGLAGAPISAQLQEGYEKVLKDYPDIKIVGYYNGEYALGPEQSGVAALLAANPQVDGILTLGRNTGAEGCRPSDGSGCRLLLQRRRADMRGDQVAMHPRLQSGVPLFGGDQARGRDTRHGQAS